MKEGEIKKKEGEAFLPSCLPSLPSLLSFSHPGPFYFIHNSHTHTRSHTSSPSTPRPSHHVRHATFFQPREYIDTHKLFDGSDCDVLIPLLVIDLVGFGLKHHVEDYVDTIYCARHRCCLRTRSQHQEEYPGESGDQATRAACASQGAKQSVPIWRQWRMQWQRCLRHGVWRKRRKNGKMHVR